VNTYPILVVDDRYESSIADAAANRLAGKHPGFNDRVAAAAEGLRRFLANDTSTVTIPALRNYPYRG
jgi:hypothetical protein